MEKIRKKIEDFAKKMLLKGGNSHNWEHTQRVLRLCRKIWEKEGGDWEIIEISALLHDIGRYYQNKSKNKISHAKIGVKLAKKILKKIKMNEGKITKILHCIETHRYREDNKPKTKEAKILFDADKLDAIGAVGIGRAFQFAGEVNAILHNKDVDIHKTKSYSVDDTAYREFLVKLQYIKDKMMTSTGKKVAQKRHNFMVKFFKTLNDEIDLKDF